MHEYNQVFLDTYSTVAFLIFIMSFMYIFLLHTLLNHRFQGIEYNTAVEVVLTMFNPILPFTVPALPSYEWGSIPTSPGAPRQVPVVIKCLRNWLHFWPWCRGSRTILIAIRILLLIYSLQDPDSDQKFYLI